jgi:hypothetical protein
VDRHRYAVEQYARIRSRSTGGVLAEFVAATQLVEALDRRLHDDKPTPDQDVAIKNLLPILKQQLPDELFGTTKSALKRAYEPSLAGRLRRLDNELSHLISDLIGNRRWCADIAAIRNIVSHGLETSARLIHDKRPLQVATEIALLLFEAHWLRLAGFSEDQTRSLITDSIPHGWVVRGIRQHYDHLHEMAERRQDC